MSIQVADQVERGLMGFFILEALHLRLYSSCGAGILRRLPFGTKVSRWKQSANSIRLEWLGHLRQQGRTERQKVVRLLRLR